MRISVFGLGYVGCVSSACFSEDGHDVIGVDTNGLKVDIINDGRSPVVERARPAYKLFDEGRRARSHNMLTEVMSYMA